MSEEKVQERHCMLFEFQKGNNAMKAKRNLCDVVETEAVTARICHRWLWHVQLRMGDFSLKDEDGSGRYQMS
ncbi:HTH_48 domain-containing protein [Trichonephila clavipes]|uniref:HTH_48 domain-containing protein n=1 Tax=Trichonephila clavipes TaxID=2585209 RepID=A0A8X6VRA7_TRICX|nr:HTH_48 domain-containing protein [Trichonephila clavipes]